jgi:hypothetical protein
MPYRPVRAVRQKIQAPTGSGQNIAGDKSRNLPSAVVTLLCAAGLVVFAVIITLLPFVLL